MKLNALCDADNHVVGVWITDKNKEDVVECSFLGKPKQVYPKGYHVKVVNVFGDDDFIFKLYWEYVKRCGLTTCDPAYLKALWFDEFGSLKVNS